MAHGIRVVQHAAMNNLLAAGLLGMVGALVMAVSDGLLLGTARSGWAYYRDRLGRGSMGQVAVWRLYVGSGLGVLAAPLQLSGVWQVYVALRPAGEGLARPVAFTFAYAIILGIAIHATFALMGRVLQAQAQVGEGDRPLLAQIDRQFERFWLLLLGVAALSLVVGSGFFVAAVAGGQTLYPGWMAWLTPAGLFLLVMGVTAILPRPGGGYLAPAVYNLALLLFFLLSTLALRG